MNAMALLVTPWRTGMRSVRILTLVILVLTGAGGAVLALLVHNDDARMGAAMLLTFGLAYAWAFWLAGAVMLARDAHTLRVPGVERTAVLSMLLWMLLSVTVPTALLALAGSDVASVAAILSLGVCGGLGFALLPRALASAMGFLPALAIGAGRFIPMPHPGGPYFPLACASVDALILIGVTLRWRSLVGGAGGDSTGWRGALIAQISRNGLQGSAGCAGEASTRVLARTPQWMAPRAALGNAGPAHPVRALRVALGGLWLPQTAQARLRQLLTVVLPLLLMVPVFILVGAGSDHHGKFAPWHQVLTSAGVGAGIWLGVFGTFMLALISVMTVRQRWRRHNAELPLLALLPGLGKPAQMRRELLRTVLGLPLLGQTLLLVVVAAIFLGLHLGTAATLLAMAVQVGGALLLATLMLDVLGGGRLGKVWLSVLGVVMSVLAIASMVLPFILQRPERPLALQWSITAVGATWVVVGGVLALLSVRGWRRLQQRPHPFLAGA